MRACGLLYRTSMLLSGLGDTNYSILTIDRSFMYTLSFPMFEDAKQFEAEALKGCEMPQKDAFELITTLLAAE